jgi:hypothetical protein
LKVYLDDEQPMLYEIFDLSMQINKSKRIILNIYNVKLEDKFFTDDNKDIIYRFRIYGDNFLQQYKDAEVSIGAIVSKNRGVIGLYEIAEKNNNELYYYNILGNCYEQEAKNVIVLNKKYDIENRRYHEKFDLGSFNYLHKCNL